MFRMDIPCERKKLNDVLDGINNTGNISFDEFKEFVKKAQATDSNSRYFLFLHFTVYSFTIDVEEDSCRENQLIHYFNVMEKGKKIVRWPPPWFSPTITILQLVLFSVNWIAGGTLVKYLQFHT